ncbi:MAG: type II toxin-antitoxin system RelE/ParE family toxin [bacterium]
MDVRYRKQFLKDLKKLKHLPIYDQIVNLAFKKLPKAKTINEISGVKAMRGYPKRYRIRIGNYRIGIEAVHNDVEVMRVLLRSEFYRYFP